MSIATRRVLPEHHAEVREQLRQIERRVERDSLSRGDRGPAVEALQQRLKSLAVLDGPANGTFDARTERAVRRFQEGAGLLVDGVAGDKTLRGLRAHTAFVEDNFETAAQRGQRGADVRGAENMLRDLGMAPGKVDGLFDAQTAAAVQRFRAGDPTLPEGRASTRAPSRACASARPSRSRKVIRRRACACSRRTSSGSGSTSAPSTRRSRRAPPTP